MKEKVMSVSKKAAGEVDLSDDIFGLKPNKALIYEAVKQQMASKRQGDAATRNHKMVSGTTAKMYRQKGTGRARHGDARTNIFVGGGKAFGPHPRDYGYSIPKKARKGALKAALSLKKGLGQLIVVDELSFKAPKTKDALKAMEALGISGGLIVVEGKGKDRNLELSFRNVPGVKIEGSGSLSTYDVMRYEHVVITVPALNLLQGRLA